MDLSLAEDEPCQGFFSLVLKERFPVLQDDGFPLATEIGIQASADNAVAVGVRGKVRHLY